jgi:phosphoglycerate dehydrogenase-like enzyme
VSSNLVIWCNANFSPAALSQIEESVRPHRLVISQKQSASNLSVGGSDSSIAEADVALGQPTPQDAMQASKLRWVHLNSAGYTRYDTPEFRAALSGRGAMLTNSSAVYAEPCAEHAFSFVLAQARQLPQSQAEQLGARGWPILERRAKSRLLLEQNVTLLGFGAIGRRLAELLAPFHVQLTAVRRKVTQELNVTILPDSQLAEAVAGADHVINILPENAGTRGLIDARIFGAMKPGACFYNIGRGTTVDQAALLDALESGRLAAAYLDVTDPEPLPPEHPLWKAPNCFITPHTAGGFDVEEQALARHFLDNLQRFADGQPLHDRVI